MSDQNSSNRVSWSSSVSKREYRNLDKVDRKNDDRKSFKHGDDGPSKRKRSPERDYSSSSRSKKISKDSRLERSHEHSRGEGRSSRKSERDEDEKSSRHGENGTSKRKRSPDRDHSSSRSKKSSKDSRTERSHEHSRSKGRSSRRNDKEEEKDPYEGLTEEEKMAKMMGFTTFDTTKGKPVTGNNIGAVHILHKRKYRQYMNRKGGFNRPLDFVA